MKERTRDMRNIHGKASPRQRGVVVPIVAIGLLAILAVAGLALDGSHVLGNKTRIQNTVDAAALAAAKVLDQTENTDDATDAANELFNINASSAGNHELDSASDDISVTVQFSATLNPFVPGSYVPGSDSWFVRVIATGFDTRTTLSSVLGIDEIPTPATAVAGPSGPLGTGAGAEICDIAPIAVCKTDIPMNEWDVLRVLKPTPSTTGDIGPGNYKMLDMGCPEGAGPERNHCLRKNMAGSFDQCVRVYDEDTGEGTVDTKTGVNSGQVSQGFNTRFDEAKKANLSVPPYHPDKDITEQGQGYTLKACAPKNDPLTDYIFLTDTQGNNYCKDFPDDFDPETDTLPEPYADEWVTYEEDINYNYCNYIGGASCNTNAPIPGGADFVGPKNNPGKQNRRILKFPVIECTGDNPGNTTDIRVVGSACFFMLQSLAGDQADGAGQIFGQFIGDCGAKGTAGLNPGPGTSGPLLYKIQLYKNPDSGDS